MQICILGAGIVGLSTAWELNRRGHDIIVVDRALPGGGASRGNGAQLSYSYVAPLADPSIWRELPDLLLSASSPLRLKLKLDSGQWSWLWKFLSACNSKASRSTTSLLLELAARSRTSFEEMLSDVQPDCHFSRSGKLVIYSEAGKLRRAGAQVQLQRGFGCQQEVLGLAECLKVEPALQDYAKNIAGGVFTPSECAADCFKLCQDLAHLLIERGVQFVTSAPLTGLEIQDQRLRAVRTEKQKIEAETYVFALGAESSRWARRCGARIPVYPLKGYSITLDLDGEQSAAPSVCVTDSAHKTVFARVGEKLRVAGIVEISGYDTTIAPSQVHALLSTARRIFPRCSRFETLRPWVGMRPATPTGAPITGRLKGAPSNVLFNTGHGALGFTLAFGAATGLAEMIEAF